MKTLTQKLIKAIDSNHWLVQRVLTALYVSLFIISIVIILAIKHR